MKTETEIRDAAIKGIRKVTQDPNLTISDEESFGTIGLDSLDLMTVTLEIEEDLDIDLNDVEPSEFKNINDIIAYIQKL